MKKRVLHVLSSQSYSGAENVAAGIINNLSNEYEMVYVSPDGPIKYSLADRGVTFIPMKDFSFSSIRNLIKIWRPNLLHTHDFTATLKTIVVAGNTPVIAHIHQNPKWLKTLNTRSLLFTLAALKLNSIIAVNPAILNTAIMKDLYNHKSRVLQNIVDIKHVREMANSFTGEAYDLAFVGRLVDVKNPLRFIKIAAEIIDKAQTELKAVIIGDGALRKNCESLINQLGMENKIILKGHLENPFPILNNSKVLVMTSRSEGLPMTAIEGLTLGKPVVVPQINGVEKVVDDSCGIICVDDQHYISGIQSILLDNNKYQSMSMSAMDRAEKLFNMQRYRINIIDMYENALN